MDDLKSEITERQRLVKSRWAILFSICKLILQRVADPFCLLTLAYVCCQLFTFWSTGNARVLLIALIILALVALDVSLSVKKLSRKVFNVELEVTKLIQNNENLFKNLTTTTKDSKKEFAYYKSCFTSTLRSGQWEYVPSNTLAKGDIIRLLNGDVAPAMVVFINFQDSRMSALAPKANDYLVFNKGTKVGRGEDLREDGAQEPIFRSDEDLHEVTRRNKREYMYFQVKNTPYIDDLNMFVTASTNQALREKKNKEILYFKNLKKLEWHSSV